MLTGQCRSNRNVLLGKVRGQSRDRVLSQRYSLLAERDRGSGCGIQVHWDHSDRRRDTQSVRRRMCRIRRCDDRHRWRSACSCVQGRGRHELDGGSARLRDRNEDRLTKRHPRIHLKKKAGVVLRGERVLLSQHELLLSCMLLEQQLFLFSSLLLLLLQRLQLIQDQFVLQSNKSNFISTAIFIQ